MLIEATTENFRSFARAALLSMVATKLVSKDKRVDEVNLALPEADPRLLKVAAIYGPNASGKSNLVGALRFMRSFVLNSSRETQTGEPIGVEPFLLGHEASSPSSKFEVVFRLDEKQYRYGFEAERTRVTAEWLYRRQTSRERSLFERSFQTIEVGQDLRKEAHGLPEKTRENALFLSVLAQFNSVTAGRVLEWFRSMNVMSGLDDQQAWRYTLARFQDDAARAAIVRLVRELDLGIEDIFLADDVDERLLMEMDEEGKIVVRHGRGRSVKTVHRVRNADGGPAGTVELDMRRHESQGTQKLFALSGPLLDALSSGQVVVIDEFDARLHPLLTKALVELFQSKNSNPRGAQLIFTTHDTNLLDAQLFRRDQIWFVEKDRAGASHLYSLAEYKVRNDASFEKDYIHGKYGGIPFIGDLGQALGADPDG